MSRWSSFDNLIAQSTAATPPRGNDASRPFAFTVVELLVVIGIIILILAFGMPAFNAMAVQQRQNKALLLLSNTLVQTQVRSVSDQTFTAVRVLPAEWQFRSRNTLDENIAGRQAISTYIYRQPTAPDPDDPETIYFEERFEPIADGPTHLLPYDTWIAPQEALFTNTRIPDSDLGFALIGDKVLTGNIGEFVRNANARENNSETLLDADDFLFVFDPRTGLYPSLTYKPWLMLGFDPTEGVIGEDGRPVGREWVGPRSNDRPKDREKFQRINFTGAVIYRREPFVATGKSAAPALRRDALERHGQTYFVDPHAGSLIAGSAEGN